MYRQFHRILESFKISETKEEIKEEAKEVKSSVKPVEKVTDQFAADDEAVEVRRKRYNHRIHSKNT